ncbi:MAG: energy-coupling factor transporter transmembrane protein EcfT [Aerococcus sp.]|nr:energy-coupling factor transporter transmembrane protein EcfT [Aerococcus sp.]
MSSKLILGRYLPTGSIIHQLDPRVKLLGMFYLLIVVFFANNWWSYLVLFTLAMAGVWLTQISLRVFIRGLRPMIFLILMTVILQLLFTHEGTVLFSFGPIALTTGGIVNAFFILLRFIFIIFISTLLTLTTAPLDMTNGLETLAGPLKKVLPVQEMALMLAIALRFVPTLMDEAEKIMDAQRARGVDFGEGSLLQRVKSFLPVLIPLFISAFDRAYDLSIAMEARGYRGDNEHRTKYRLLHWQMKDTVALLGIVAVGILAILVRQW